MNIIRAYPDGYCIGFLEEVSRKFHGDNRYYSTLTRSFWLKVLLYYLFRRVYNTARSASQKKGGGGNQ